MSIPDPTPEEAEAMKLVASKLREKPDPEDSGFMSDLTLLRFVRARPGKVDKAVEMLDNCIKWRKEVKPYAIDPATDSEVAGCLALKYLFMAGHCRAGRPVIYNIPGLSNPFKAEVRVRIMLYILEETYRHGCVQNTWVFDWSEYAKRAKDEESSKTRDEIIKILQNYYPERLGALYMLDTPWWFSLIYTLMCPFLDAKTKSKIFLNTTAVQLKKNIIDEQNLLDRFGGQLTIPASNVVDWSTFQIGGSEAVAVPEATATKPETTTESGAQ